MSARDVRGRRRARGGADPRRAGHAGSTATERLTTCEKLHILISLCGRRTGVKHRGREPESRAVRGPRETMRVALISGRAKTDER